MANNKKNTSRGFEECLSCSGGMCVKDLKLKQGSTSCHVQGILSHTD